MAVLYLFNPENDMALACGDPYYMAPANARRMAAELSALPAWYAEKGASVWLDTTHRLKIIKEQFPLQLSVNWVTELSSLKIYNKVRPWGWNPALIRHLRDAGISVEAYPTAERMHRIRELSSREIAVEVLRRCRNYALLDSVSGDGSFSNTLSACGAGRLPPITTIGESFILSSLQEVETFVLSHSEALLKAPWSGSGRGIRYTSGTFSAPLKGWVEHILTTQQRVVGEPFYDKTIDFAMEFFSDTEGRMHFIGYSLFKTDRRGTYKENLLASDIDIEFQLARYVSVSVLHRLRERLLIELAEVIKGDYCGYLGVDMMICRISDGPEKYVIHPCVEINLRMNMGVAAHFIYEKYVCQGARGRYIVEYYGCPGEAIRAHSAFQYQYPLRSEGGKIRSGYLSLTPVEEETAYQVYIIIE